MRHPDMDGAKQKFHLRVNALGPAQERRRRGEGRTRLQGKLYASTYTVCFEICKKFRSRYQKGYFHETITQQQPI